MKAEVITQDTHERKDVPLGRITVPEGPEIEAWAVEAWIADDGVLVVQIDTPLESDMHEHLRVYCNDARATGWRNP